MMPSRDELLRQAKDLGLPVTSGIYNPAKEAVTEIETTDHELLRRIREEERLGATASFGLSQPWRRKT